MQTTLYYLDTMNDDLTSVMPNFEYGELDERQKTSNSKIIELPRTPRARGRRRERK